MRLFAKSLFTASFLTASLISANVFAAPKILFKDASSKHPMLTSSSVPKEIRGVVQDLQVKRADLYEIVVYKMSDHYVLFLLSGKMWEATRMRVDLDTSGQILRIIDPYQGTENGLTSSQEDLPACPDMNVQFVAISAYPGVAAVNESMAIVSQAAKKKYKTVTILDENADGVTYKNWLSCPNLKGFYSIGHGYQEGILVGKGDLITYDFFDKEKFNNTYKDTTVVINSCLVYNFPFGTQIMHGNTLYASDFAKNPGPHAYEYIGGQNGLLMYASELSSACFVAKAIDGARMDYDTLKQCIGDQDIHYQNFGLSHPGKYFQH